MLPAWTATVFITLMHAQSQLGYDLYVFAYTEVQLMHLHLLLLLALITA